MKRFWMTVASVALLSVMLCGCSTLGRPGEAGNGNADGSFRGGDGIAGPDCGTHADGDSYGNADGDAYTHADANPCADRNARTDRRAGR